MPAQATIRKNTDDTKSGDPLEQLASLLSNDMQEVNELIVDRMQSDVKMIPQLAGYLIAAGGKRIRPLLTLACTRLYNYSGDRPYGLAAAVEFIHTATLLHDDVVDRSDKRRGQPTANQVFSNQASVLVGDFLFSRAFQLMVEDGALEILRILSNSSVIIAQGEVLQLSTTRNLDTTIDQYLDVVGAKTAALFAAACEIGPVIADEGSAAARTLYDYGYNLGMAFQIVDDVLDYSASQEKLGKTVGDDFHEGKMTAPVILALSRANAEEYGFWKRTLSDKKQDPGDFAKAQTILREHGTIGQSMVLARTYAQKAFSALSMVPNGDIKNILQEIVTFTIERDY